MIKTLYVDDEADLLELGKLFLEMSGEIEVDTAISAQDALGKLRTGDYDVVISDYQMPIMDGIAFLKKLRADSNDIPFILFTGKGREEIVIEALNSGATFYLQKGGNPRAQFRELEHKVREAVRRSRAERALLENEERLTRAQAIGLTGCWEFTWGVDGPRVWGSEGGFRLFGIPRTSDGIMPQEQVEDLILERERAHQALKDLIEKGTEYDLEYEIAPADGGPHRLIHSVAKLVQDANGRPIKVAGIIQDITERKRTEEKLRQKTALFEAQAAASFDGILVVDENLKRILVNQRIVELFNVPQYIMDNEDDSLLLKHVVSLTKCPEQFLERVRYLNDHIDEISHDEIEFKSGMVLERYSAPVFGKDGKYYGRTWTFHDITERRQFYANLGRLNRELVAIKECNRALVKARTEQELLGSICRIVCEVAGYRMAWIGMAEHDEARSVRPVAWSSYNQDYVARIRATWGEDERGKGPTGMSIKTGRTVFIQDFVDDARMAPWRENALKNGYRSCIAIPLLDGDTAFGSFMLYSDRTDGFTGDEVGLLEEMAGDLAFGILGLRAQKEREKAEEAVRRDEARNRALFELAQMSGLTPQDIAERAMDHGIELSRSQIGHIAFLNEDETVLAMQHYSKGAMERCAIEDKPMVFDTASTGLWAEAVRQRRPVLTNDYAALNPLKRGLPGGHVPIQRHMSIPVFDRGRIVAVAGMGNKDSDYTEQDATDIALLMDGMWRIIRKIQAEEELRESELEFRSLFEDNPDPISLVGIDGTVLNCNQAAATMVLMSREEIIGGTLAALGVFSVDDLVLFQRAMTTMAKGGKDAPIVSCLHRRDGTVKWVEMRASMVMKAGRSHAFQIISRDITERKLAEESLKVSDARFRALFDANGDTTWVIDQETGRIIDANVAATRMYGYSREEFIQLDVRDISAEPEKTWQAIHSVQEFIPLRYHRRKDGTLFPAEITANTFSLDGRVMIVGTARDISERLRTEEALRDMNRKMNLLSSITRHDITNQLFILNGHLSLLERGGVDPVRGEQIGKAKGSAGRIEKMIEFTRTYESIGLKEPTWHDLRTLVANGQGEVQLGSLKVVNDVPSWLQVLADPLITKVLSNLIDNAVRHGERVTMVRFSTSERDGDLVLVCEDDGHGIPTKEKERIFERGFGRNTGLGLFLSKEVLAITKIGIRECGEPGQGARFEIRVPRGSYRSGT